MRGGVVQVDEEGKNRQDKEGMYEGRQDVQKKKAVKQHNQQQKKKVEQ